MEQQSLDVLRLVLMRCPLESWLSWRLTCRALLRVADDPITLRQLWNRHRPPRLVSWPAWSLRALVLELVRPVRSHELNPVRFEMPWQPVERNTGPRKFYVQHKKRTDAWLFWRMGQCWRCVVSRLRRPTASHAHRRLEHTKGAADLPHSWPAVLRGHRFRCLGSVTRMSRLRLRCVCVRCSLRRQTLAWSAVTCLMAGREPHAM